MYLAKLENDLNRFVLGVLMMKLDRVFGALVRAVIRLLRTVW